MKKYKFIINLSVLSGLFIFSFSSCKKTWLCEIPDPGFLCIRGTDTIYSQCGIDEADTYSSIYMQNLRAYYEALGYTVYEGTNVYSSNSNYITNKATVDALEQNGVKCIAK